MTGALLSLCVSGSAAGLLPPAAGTALAAATVLTAAALYVRRLQRVRQSRMPAEACLPIAAETPVQADTAERRTPPGPRHDNNPPPAAAPARGDERLLLLVEDDVISQRAVIRQLGALGHAAHIANNGREALEAFAFHSYALVLMDCQMPVMDGFETTRRIRMLDRSRNRHTPVIALTANPTQSTRERCIAAGMEDCLAKPIQRAQLGELLERYLPPPVPQHAAAAGFMFNLPRQRDIFGDDRARRQHMLERFAADSGPLIAQLGSAIAGADLEDIAARVRQLTGACASIGLDELTTLAHAAERAVLARNLRELGQIHRAMMAAFQRLSDFIATQKSERA